MARSRIPSLNGVETELHDLKRGHGVSIVTIEKLNSKPHILAALRVSLDGSMAPIDRAYAARAALIDFIKVCPALDEEHRTTLTYLLNLDSDAAWYRLKLGDRRIELEQALQVGRRKITAYEIAAMRGSAPRSGGDSRVILGVGQSPVFSSAVTVSGLSRSG